MGGLSEVGQGAASVPVLQRCLLGKGGVVLGHPGPHPAGVSALVHSLGPAPASRVRPLFPPPPPHRDPRMDLERLPAPPPPAESFWLVTPG